MERGKLPRRSLYFQRAALLCSQNNIPKLNETYLNCLFLRNNLTHLVALNMGLGVPTENAPYTTGEVDEIGKV